MESPGRGEQNWQNPNATQEQLGLVYDTFVSMLEMTAPLVGAIKAPDGVQMIKGLPIADEFFPVRELRLSGTAIRSCSPSVAGALEVPQDAHCSVSYWPAHYNVWHDQPKWYRAECAFIVTQGGQTSRYILAPSESKQDEYDVFYESAEKGERTSITVEECGGLQTLARDIPDIVSLMVHQEGRRPIVDKPDPRNTYDGMGYTDMPWGQYCPRTWEEATLNVENALDLADLEPVVNGTGVYTHVNDLQVSYLTAQLGRKMYRSLHEAQAENSLYYLDGEAQARLAAVFYGDKPETEVLNTYLVLGRSADTMKNEAVITVSFQKCVRFMGEDTIETDLLVLRDCKYVLMRYDEEQYVTDAEAIESTPLTQAQYEVLRDL